MYASVLIGIIFGVFTFFSFYISDYNSFISQERFDNSVLSSKLDNIDIYDKIKTIYLNNYDFLNLPANKFPYSTYSSNLSGIESFLNQFVGRDIVLNSKRLCERKNVNEKFRCSFISFDSDIFNVVESLDSRYSIYSLLNALGDKFGKFVYTSVTYEKNTFPSLKIRFYDKDFGDVPDLSRYFDIDLSDLIPSMVLDVKSKSDYIYSLYGEDVKRKFKGFTKSDVKFGLNPFNVIGDSINTFSSNRYYYTGDKSIFSGMFEKTGVDSIVTLNPYIVVGNKFFEGFSTSNSFLLSFEYIDNTSLSYLPSGKRILDNNYKVSNSVNYELNPLLLFNYENVRRFYREKCDSSVDVGCDIEPLDFLKVDDFCLSVEPCYVIFDEVNRVIRGTKTLSLTRFLNDRYSFSLNSYTNPFYPNAFKTLYKEEQKGLIVSANNEGTPDEGSTYHFSIGFKFIPVSTKFENRSDFNRKNYIISKYAIQSR